jgi:carbamoyl-phosphate synthase large subunit
VGLSNNFRQSFSELGIKGRIIAIDAMPHSPAGQLADAYYVVPPCTDSGFVAEVLDLCKREDVNLIVPTIDPELPVYARAKNEFSKKGTHVVISSAETVAICSDKVQTHSWLVSQGFPTPRQATPEVVLGNPQEWPSRLILKPKNGSASIGIRVVTTINELEAYRADGLVVQELVSGAEHTINVFVDREGHCRCAVPHLRMEVRAGEVSKGCTVKDQRLIGLASKIAETLPGAYGALNVQCFLTPSGDLQIIEMNARFGGGYPLAHHAGAHMTTWLLEEAMGDTPHGPFDQWQDGHVMLRYDEAVFLNKDEVRSHTDANSVYCVRS